MRYSLGIMRQASLTGCIFAMAISSSCEWNRKDREATESHFRSNSTEYLMCVSDCELGRDYNGPLKDALYAKTKDPLVVEWAPVNFYYSIVFARSESGLQQSEAMIDEGTVLKSLGHSFYLVRRGFQ